MSGTQSVMYSCTINQNTFFKKKSITLFKELITDSLLTVSSDNCISQSENLGYNLKMVLIFVLKIFNNAISGGR